MKIQKKKRVTVFDGTMPVELEVTYQLQETEIKILSASYTMSFGDKELSPQDVEDYREAILLELKKAEGLQERNNFVPLAEN